MYDDGLRVAPRFASGYPHEPCQPAVLYRRKRTIRRPPKIVPIARKAAATPMARYEGDTGTPELKKRLGIELEARARTSTGHVTLLGHQSDVHQDR